METKVGMRDWQQDKGNWAHAPIPNPQSPIPNPQSPRLLTIGKNRKKLININ